VLHLKALLTPDELRQARQRLGDDAPWRDGAGSAGAQAHGVKRNHQLAPDSEASAAVQSLVLGALQRDALFFSAALPRRVLPPRVNRYRAGPTGQAGEHEHYGAHIDNAILRAGADWLRSDLSCTVFLSDPADYDGGELVVHGPQGAQRHKLPAGDALLYPARSVHEVTPVTRGERLAAFFWVQSLVAADARRALLFELDMNLLALRARHGESPETTALSGVYHNLLREWAQP